MDTDFDRERDWWNAKAVKEDREKYDESVNKALRWREIEKHLDGVRTVLCVGGGTGAFSIPLSARGFAVTHLDISPAMLEIARRKATDADAAGIEFVEGNAVDLGRFPDRAFDLVLNMDGAISFCGTAAERAIRESCRVTRETLLISVCNRANMIATWVAVSLRLTDRFVPAVDRMISDGLWHQYEFPENAALTKGVTQDYAGPLRAFTRAELRRTLMDQGLRVVRCGGLGSLANLCGIEIVQKAKQDEAVFQKFLDLCDRFDKEFMRNGPGTRERAGLIAVAKRDQK